MKLIFQWFGQKRRRRFFALFLGAITLLVFLRMPFGTLPPASNQENSLTPLERIPVRAEQVLVGLYWLNIYNLDITSNTYYLDAYVWFRWQGEIDPIANLEFVNAIEDWGMTQKPGYEQPLIQPDGSKYQILQVEGRFLQNFNLVRYPLDKHQISVLIENSIHTADELVYLADTQDSGYAETLAIQGWQIADWQSKNVLRRYQSNFGLINKKTNQYSRVQFAVFIERPISYFIWKLLLPLLIVLISGCGALMLHPRYAESRIAIPITSLLTIVFLQQSYSADLPEISYLVLLDKIYALAYLLIISAILEAIFTAEWATTEDKNDYDRIIRIDRPIMTIQAIVLIIGVGLLLSL